ncbi:MAG: PrgI family protein [Candidatus Roizmanbacteria bacterium]|nr:PrgI family protein [Candidatus Roizmanbacteria bacterium]
MEQHAIPRQITSYEFKLIGFMTLKQFLYLVLFGPLGYIVSVIFPIPFLNIILGIAVGVLGIALAFLPINDRPLDIWIRNIWKRLNSPTQFTYHKHNQPITLLQNLYFVSDPHHVMAHIESQQMLASYLEKTKQTIQPNPQKKQVLQAFQNFQNPVPVQSIAAPPLMSSTPPLTATQVAQAYSSPVITAPQEEPVATTPSIQKEHKPFFIGTVKNGKRIPLPGILLYVKNNEGAPVRLLKTNQHGIFATFNPLPPGDYIFEIKDPKSSYLFDTMKITIQDVNIKSIEFYSKELM